MITTERSVSEALSGVNPVRGANPADTARRIGGQLPPLLRYRSDLPRELTQALDIALAPNPRQRGTLDALRECFEGALKQGLEQSPHAAKDALEHAPVPRRAVRDAEPLPAPPEPARPRRR